jgi:hypothetical protein
MAYRRIAIGDDVEPETELVVLSRVDASTKQLVQWTKDEDRRRKIAIGIAIVTGLFAAVRLGIVVLPHFKKAKALGEL